MEILDINGAKIYKYSVGPSSYLLNPFEGATLINWNVALADGDVRDVIYWPEDQPLSGADPMPVLGGMFLMFPFSGGSFVDGKEGSWIAPDGKRRPMRKHGYANSGKFEKVFASDTDIKLRYVPEGEALEAYPFDYNFEVFYKFGELAFSCELVLTNNGSERIPWGAGMHPFFAMPWAKGTTRKDYRLVHDAKKAHYILKDGSIVPADGSKNCFADTEIQNRLHTHFKSGVVKVGTKNGEEEITIRINGGARPDPAITLVTWSASETEPYFCVEPWMSLPNSAPKPAHYVEPNSTKSFSVDFSLM
ncbi:MAG: hypothetical protein IJI37_02610 [Opitutales bacterium]|nr:hypothetical protein [Opitutales bacterium]